MRMEEVWGRIIDEMSQQEDGVGLTALVDRLKDYAECIVRITDILRRWDARERNFVLKAAKKIIDAEKKAIGTKESMR